MSEVIKYIVPEAKVELEVGYEQDTIWLSQKQMAILFEKDSDTIGLHLRNIYSNEELNESSTTEDFSVVQLEGKRQVTRKMKFYNLDAIISVGYRVNSKRGTQFRIWATKVLKEKLLESVNRRNSAQELVNVVRYIGRITVGKALEKEEAVGLLHVITDYSHALEILDQYDHQQIEVAIGDKASIRVTAEEIRQLVKEMHVKFGAGNLFGVEKDQSLESSVAAIYQTFDGKELYPSPEIKATNLLYFLVKNHSFVDGNKRIAAATFIWFLHKNNILFDNLGIKVLDNNTLVALTLMLAESNPNDREMLVKVVVKLLM